jgi:serine/threonine protein kinase
MELSVQNVYGLLIRSQLLSIDGARAMFERWQREAKDKANQVEVFTHWLVAQGYLTEYQVALLSRGHAEGFFLNQYKILERAGQGRMAGVYKAAHELGQIVAIKVLPPSKAKDPVLFGRFQREARLAVKLKHPNIVRTFQVGQANGLNYLVMEYLDGETLDETLLRRGKLPPTEAVRIIYQVLLGLQHIHEHGLVHRDLKPSNLMLVPRPSGQPETTLRCTVKILDIGLGRALFDEAVSDQSSDPTLTVEGVLLGTPDYMSPEQARDPRGTDIRSDIYSLGCVLYHLLAGRQPFPDNNIISQMIRHATEPARPLKELNPAVPDGLQQIVNWMTAKDPAQRYPTPERAAQALQVFLVAGADQQTLLEADPKMAKYLTWVENENSKSEMQMPATPPKPAAGTPAASARPQPAAGGIPLAMPVTAPAAAPRPEKVRHKPSRGKRRSKKHRHQPPTAVPVAGGKPSAPKEAPGQTFDVELVAAPPPVISSKSKPKGGFQLGRRDFLLFGTGVGGTLLAIGLAWLLSRVFGRKPPPAPDQDTE